MTNNNKCNGDESVEAVYRVVNRHMARLMDELEEGGCAKVFRDAVKGKIVWMRNDIIEVVKEK